MLLLVSVDIHPLCRLLAEGALDPLEFDVFQAREAVMQRLSEKAELLTDIVESEQTISQQVDNNLVDSGSKRFSVSNFLHVFHF